MRPRNTVFALLVLAGLACFIYYYEYRGEEARQTAEESAKNLLTFERESIQAIEIARSGAGVIALSKEPEGWSLTADGIPGPTRADQEKVDSMLSSAGFLRIEQKLEGVAESELEGFHLQDPAARVTLRRGEGKPEISFRLGDATPVGGNRYAMRAGSPDVLVISGGVDVFLAAEAATLRNRKIVGVDLWKVARFSIEKGERVLTLAHGAAGSNGQDWRMERPVAFPADATKAQALWYDLQSAEAESFASEKPGAAELGAFGLTPPALILTVEPKEGAPPVRVMFGRGEEPGARFARRSDASVVMKVKQELVDKLEAAAERIDEMRDSRVAPIDRFRISGIVVRRPGATATLVKDDASKWHWGGAEGAEMQSEEINALFDALESSRATGYLDAAPPDAAGDPPLALILREGAAESSPSVTVTVSAGSVKAGRRVNSSVTTTAYIVPPTAIDTLIARAADLKEPQPTVSTPSPAAAGDPNEGKSQ